MKNPKEITDFLEYYYVLFKEPFRVQRFRKTPYKWINYKTKCKRQGVIYPYEDYETYVNYYGKPNSREILPTEIVLDIDYHTQDLDKSGAFEITLAHLKSKLLEFGLSYSLWKSGGSGYHFHLFFDELKQYPKFERDEIKRLMVKQLAYGFLGQKEGRANVDLPVMIQVEKEISRHGGRKTLIEWVERGINKIPKEVMKKYEEEKALQKTYTPIQPSFNGEMPNTVKFFLEYDVPDCRKRALFILASWYAQQGFNKTEIYQKLYDWNGYHLRGYLPKIAIISTIGSVLKSRRRVGSPYRIRLIKELGYDIKD